jgi:choice-of-anchor A domain-containing protein
VCRQASCAGNVETHEATCNGSGSCPSSTTATCAPFVCGANACLTQCTTVADCSTGNYCSAQGQCLFDTEPPVLQLPAPLVLEGTSPAGAQAHFTATATDAIVGAVPVTCTPASGSTFALGTTQVTCSAADGHGNTAQGSFTVTVVDTTPPTLSIVGSDSMTLECGTAYVEQGATALDICSGDLTSAVVITGAVNSSVVGTYTVHYAVADGVGLTASGDRVVNVEDTQAPVISMNPGPSVLECFGAPYQDPGATAADVCSGDLTSSIVTSSNLNQSRAGQYAVSYSVTDSAGHTSTAVRQLTVGSCCFNIRLGDYNLFLLGNYTGGHDVQGKVAAGGNITLTDFSVGVGLPDNNISNTLVAGGNLTLLRGGVWGDAWYGGTYSADQTVVYPRGSPAQGAPIDFADRFASLRNLSSRLGRVPANGRTTREVWGGIMMSGTDPSMNVFDLDASAFSGAVYFNIDAPAGSLAVVNIRGASASLARFSMAFSGGLDAQSVLYNFVDTTRIDASSIGIRGTVLAPYAHITFNDGAWDGGIYAVSLTGNAEGHILPMTDRDVCR